MTLDRWQEIIGNIKDNFDVLNSGSEHLEDDGGVDVDYIVFSTEQGKFRLELVSKPVVLDKKTTYSKRIGSETKVDYVYSDSERANKMLAYRFNLDLNDWEEMDAKSFA